MINIYGTGVLGSRVLGCVLANEIINRAGFCDALFVSTEIDGAYCIDAPLTIPAGATAASPAFEGDGMNVPVEMVFERE